METYLYIHKKKNTNEIFYVGIGTMKSSKKEAEYSRSRSLVRRNAFWKRTAAKYGYDVEVLTIFPNRQEAIEEEIWWIKELGRRDLGTGVLVNMTDGGDGARKVVFSEERVEKVRSFMLGNKHSLGRVGGEFQKKRATESCSGEKHWNVKLKEEDVSFIRTYYKNNKKGKVTFLANKYGVHRMTIQRVVKEESWKTVKC